MNTYSEHPEQTVSASEEEDESPQAKRLSASERALWSLYESIVKHVEFTKINDPFLAGAIREASEYLKTIIKD